MNSDLISREALKEDFKTRLENAKRWKENAINRGDEEIVIRATATIDFICEVIMTIDNAPTVAVSCKDCDGYEAGYSAGLKDTERPQGDIFPMDIVAGKCPIEVGGNCPLKSQGEPKPVSERQKRALAIVDALTEKRLINVMERGCLRRSILLEPERSQDESISLEDGLKKARRGKYVIYDVDFLLDNLAREITIMESTRQWKAGKGNDNE